MLRRYIGIALNWRSLMAAELHPAASHHLPSFITPPGETDILMVITAVILAISVLLFGLVFFRLHTLPERMAHGSHKLQFEIVAVLGLLALLTHNHAFWVAGLLLALIDLPDLPGWLGRIAGAVERIAGHTADDSAAAPAAPRETVEAKQATVDATPAEGTASSPFEARRRSAKQKKATHA
jgi:hypothetical protein